MNELISELNFFGALPMLDQKKYDKFLDLIALINRSRPYITETCEGDIGSNLLRMKWAKIERMSEALSGHFNNEEKYYGRGFKANIELTDTGHTQ